jgi:hypothetical protein
MTSLVFYRNRYGLIRLVVRLVGLLVFSRNIASKRGRTVVTIYKTKQGILIDHGFEAAFSQYGTHINATAAPLSAATADNTDFGWSTSRHNNCRQCPEPMLSSFWTRNPSPFTSRSVASPVSPLPISLQSHRRRLINTWSGHTSNLVQ